MVTVGFDEGVLAVIVLWVGPILVGGVRLFTLT
jgi:hypothetical protein